MKKNLLILMLCVLALSALGIVMLYSAVVRPEDVFRFQAQLRFLAIGLCLVPVLVWMDYRRLENRAVVYALAGFCLVLLIAVFIPGASAQSHGAKRWLRYIGQPSEFAKPAFVVVLSAYLAARSKAKTGAGDLKEDFLKPLLFGCVPALLIFVEPDWGTATLFVMLTIALLLLADARASYLAITVFGAAAVLAVLVSFNATRFERVLVFLNPEKYQHTQAGWQIWQSILAIGSGGIWGHFLDGSLHKYGFVPEQQTDFIFARLGEEIGLWGSTLAVLLYLGIFLCGLQILKQARDRFGYFVAAGCTTVIALQACINIAVATSLVPNKGLPLPFMSYGGSGLIAMFACVGLLGSVAWHSSSGSKSTPPSVQLRLF